MHPSSSPACRRRRGIARDRIRSAGRSGPSSPAQYDRNTKQGEACACDLVEPIGKSQPTVSRHLEDPATRPGVGGEAGHMVLVLDQSQDESATERPGLKATRRAQRIAGP